MVEGLRASGSDFSVGNLRRLRHGELQRIIWSRTVHRQDRLGTTLEEFPAALQDIIACNRMFRTAFWREQVGGFEGGIAYEDHVPMLTAYVRARRFDVLQKVTYHWRIREDLTSTGQQKARLRQPARPGRGDGAGAPVAQRRGAPAVHDAWVGRALEVDFPPFLPFALTGDDAYRCAARRDVPDLPRPRHPGVAGPRARRHARPRAPRRAGALERPAPRGRLVPLGAEHAAHRGARRPPRRRLPRELRMGRRAASRTSR